MPKLETWSPHSQIPRLSEVRSTDDANVAPWTIPTVTVTETNRLIYTKNGVDHTSYMVRHIQVAGIIYRKICGEYGPEVSRA